jgi:hypothetical protein
MQARDVTLKRKTTFICTKLNHTPRKEDKQQNKQKNGHDLL